jgi:hypothetical protein
LDNLLAQVEKRLRGEVFAADLKAPGATVHERARQGRRLPTGVAGHLRVDDRVEREL